MPTSGVQTVGLETMEGIKSWIYEGIVQQEEKDKGNGSCEQCPVACSSADSECPAAEASSAIGLPAGAR